MMRSILPIMSAGRREASAMMHQPWRGRSSGATMSAGQPKSISAILSSARKETPLKDAVKFVQPGTKSKVWTFHELSSHVDALASGLCSLGYKSGDRIMSAIAPHHPEYAVLLLAAARAKLTLVTIPMSSSDDMEGTTPPSIDMLGKAILELKPVALFVPHETPSGLSVKAHPDDRIVASVNPILHALDGDIALRDAAGLSGYVSVTGRSFHSPRFPSLRHVVHTGADNVRAAISFRSLLVYDGADVTSNDADVMVPLLVQHSDPDAGTTEADILKEAEDVGSRLSLSSDHGDKEGKLVVKPDLSKQAASGAIAALMRQSLWLCAHPQSIDEIVAEENAIVV